MEEGDGSQFVDEDEWISQHQKSVSMISDVQQQQNIIEGDQDGR